MEEMEVLAADWFRYHLRIGGSQKEDENDQFIYSSLYRLRDLALSSKNSLMDMHPSPLTSTAKNLASMCGGSSATL
jgi:hypothetical protein